MQQAELRMLVADCLRLWNVPERVELEADGIEVATAGGKVLLRAARVEERPARWVLTEPDGRTRTLPSITATLSALRRAITEQ
jgi:hypothetical protein